MSVPTIVIDLVNSSGNNFHIRVVTAFREREWKTMISPYYLDVATNKSREIDLVAEKAWTKPADYRESQPGLLSIKLLIECKYIAQETVFWFDQRDLVATGKWLLENTPLRSIENTYTQRHHYLSSGNTVAKVFSSGKDRAGENEPIFKAINQSLHATVYLRGSESILPEEGRAEGLKTIGLPVLLVDSFDRFYRVDITSPDEVTRITNNFQLEVNYAYLDPESGNRNRDEYFLVDVVALDRLDDFLEVLDADARAMMTFMHSEH